MKLRPVSTIYEISAADEVCIVVKLSKGERIDVSNTQYIHSILESSHQNLDDLNRYAATCIEKKDRYLALMEVLNDKELYSLFGSHHKKIKDLTDENLMSFYVIEDLEVNAGLSVFDIDSFVANKRIDTSNVFIIE